MLIGNASTGSLGGLTEEEVVEIFNGMFRTRKEALANLTSHFGVIHASCHIFMYCNAIAMRVRKGEVRESLLKTPVKRKLLG